MFNWLKNHRRDKEIRAKYDELSDINTEVYSRTGEFDLTEFREFLKTLNDREREMLLKYMGKRVSMLLSRVT